MSVSGPCNRCTSVDMEWFGIGTGVTPPTHCYGDGDQPGTPGLIGSGFYCSCECRRWPHKPNELYNLAASEHPGDIPAIRDRYRELLVEHGHLIPGKPKPLPCGWPTNRTADSGSSEQVDR